MGQAEMRRRERRRTDSAMRSKTQDRFRRRAASEELLQEDYPSQHVQPYSPRRQRRVTIDFNMSSPLYATVR